MSAASAGPGLLFPPRLLALTLATAIGGGVCQSQAWEDEREAAVGSEARVDAQIPLGLA